MLKITRWLFALLPLFVCGGAGVWFALEAFIDTDFACFRTFFPSRSQIEQRTNIKFPPSTANLKWHCSNTLDQDGVNLRFTIAASDKDQFIASTVGYTEWGPYRPGEGLEIYFFNLFDDHPTSEQSLSVYKTWQASTSCGWSNNLIDMDDPTIYTVYVDYSDFEHGTCPPK